jgi:hypothetical protein
MDIKKLINLFNEKEVDNTKGNIKVIVGELNSFSTVILPENSNIIDIQSLDGILEVLYEMPPIHSYEYRHFNIHFVIDGELDKYRNLNKNCIYLKNIKIRGESCYIFIEKIKTISETRDDKINSILFFSQAL